MTIAREIYFIYMRNLRTWVGQPSLVLITVLPSVVHVPLLRRAAERHCQRPGLSLGRTTTPTSPP